MKKEMSLEEAKKYYGQQDLAVDGDHFIKPPLQSSQRPNITMELSTSFTVNGEGRPQSDEQFRSFPEYTNGMKMDFQGEPKVLFGKYKEGENGPVFSITDPKEAEQVMIRSGWGYEYYPDESLYGQGPDSEEAKSALYFERLNYGNDQGADYYIVDVGHVLGEPDRDASEYLAKMSSLIEKEEKDFDIKREATQTKHDFYQKAIVDKLESLQDVIEDSSLPKDGGVARQLLDAQVKDDHIYVKGLDFKEEIPFDEKGLARMDKLTDLVQDTIKDYENNIDKLNEYKKALGEYGVEIKDDVAEIYNFEGMNYAVEYEHVTDGLSGNKFSLTDSGMEKLDQMANQIIENEKNTEIAYDEFKDIESKIEDFANSLESIQENAIILASLGEQYMTLSDQYGFERKFDIEIDHSHELEQNGRKFDEGPGDDR